MSKPGQTYEDKKRERREAEARAEAHRIERIEEENLRDNVSKALADVGLNIHTDLRIDGNVADLTINDKPAPQAPPPLLRYVSLQNAGMTMHFLAAGDFYSDPAKYAVGMVRSAESIRSLKTMLDKERERRLVQEAAGRPSYRPRKGETKAEARRRTAAEVGSVRPTPPAPLPRRVEESLRRNRSPRKGG